MPNNTDIRSRQGRTRSRENVSAGKRRSAQSRQIPRIVWALLAEWLRLSALEFHGNIVDREIRPGETIELKSTLDEKRTFKLKIKEFVPEKRLVWGDTMGSRVYTYRKSQGGSVLFTMSEKIGGPLIPVICRDDPVLR